MTRRAPRGGTSPVEAVVGALAAARDKTGLAPLDLFGRFVSASEIALRGGSGVEWARAAEGLDGAMPELQSALGELMLAADEGYSDLLGPAYSAICRGDARRGQFFTPASGARLLASLTLPAGVGAGGEPFCVLDTACGSGGLLLAFAESLLRGERPAERVLFVGVDIDPLCAGMTRLNLRLHGLADNVLFVKGETELTQAERDLIATSAPLGGPPTL